MEPNDAGRVSNSVECVRSRSVLGWPGNGDFPCRESIDVVECAENEGELE